MCIGLNLTDGWRGTERRGGWPGGLTPAEKPEAQASGAKRRHPAMKRCSKRHLCSISISVNL